MIRLPNRTQGFALRLPERLGTYLSGRRAVVPPNLNPTSTTDYAMNSSKRLHTLLILFSILLVAPLVAQDPAELPPHVSRFFDEKGLPIVRPGSDPITPSAAADGDENWDDRFGSVLPNSGVDDEVFAMATNGNLLFIAGAFTKAGTLEVGNIVSWNGNNFDYTGPGPEDLQGTNGIVNALAVSGGYLFVGGQFTKGGLTNVQNLARYEILSRSWNSIGGITSTSGQAFVSSMLVDGDKLYVGGTFNRAGNVAANNIAVYDLTTKQWSALGGAEQGVQGNVNAIAKGPDGIYVGGSFSAAGGVAASSIARWDSGAWHALADGGVDGFVNAIAVIDSSVFVAGGFAHAGDTAASNIARWRVDTATWTRLTGVFWLSHPDGPQFQRLAGNGTDNPVRTLHVDGKNLYVGGTFVTSYPGDYTTSNLTANYIARWHEWSGDPIGNTLWWQSLGRGMDGFVNTVVQYKGALYAGGAFSRAGGQPAQGIATWREDRWFSLASGLGDYVTTMTSANGEVYVGGVFDHAGNGRANRLARLDGTNWEVVPDAFAGTIYTVEADGEWVYVGGRFDAVGDMPAKNAARYNTTSATWSTLGAHGGPDNPTEDAYVASIEVADDGVYLGGTFTRAGDDTAARNIVRWNGGDDTWTSLGAGVNGAVFALHHTGTELYAGGRFLGAGTVNDAENVAVWRDGAWHGLAGGVNDAVWALEGHGGRIVAGGDFTYAGGDTVNHIAAWDPDEGGWNDMRGGVTSDFLPTVSALTTIDDILYVGGAFDTAGGAPAANVARWNGGEWRGLGSGVDNYIYAMTGLENRLYVAGAFHEAGAKPSVFFGIYTDPLLSVGDVGSAVTGVIASPNPILGATRIGFATSERGRVTVTIVDALGRIVATPFDGALPAGEHTALWEPAPTLAAGVYYCRIESKEGSRIAPVILVR